MAFEIDSRVTWARSRASSRALRSSSISMAVALAASSNCVFATEAPLCSANAVASCSEVVESWAWRPPRHTQPTHVTHRHAPHVQGLTRWRAHLHLCQLVRHHAPLVVLALELELRVGKLALEVLDLALQLGSLQPRHTHSTPRRRSISTRPWTDTLGEA